MSIKTITLTLSDSGTTFSLGASEIVKVFAEGSGSKVLYWDEGARRKQLVVDEAPSAITTAAGNLIEVTDRESGTAKIQINADRIIRMYDDSDSKARIEYDQEGARLDRLVVDENLATVQGLVDAL